MRRGESAPTAGHLLHPETGPSIGTSYLGVKFGDGSRLLASTVTAFAANAGTFWFPSRANCVFAGRCGNNGGALDPRAADLLSRPIVGQLGFIGLDGYPHVLPVWFEHRDGELLVASPAGTYKGRELARDGRAALSVSTIERPYLIASVVGDATVESLPEKERIELISALAMRYLGEDGGREYLEVWRRGGHPGDGELIRLRPRKVNFYIS